MISDWMCILPSVLFLVAICFVPTDKMVIGAKFAPLRTRAQSLVVCVRAAGAAYLPAGRLRFHLLHVLCGLQPGKQSNELFQSLFVR